MKKPLASSRTPGALNVGVSCVSGQKVGQGIQSLVQISLIQMCVHIQGGSNLGMPMPFLNDFDRNPSLTHQGH